MLELRKGNIFDTDTQALVNPVNTEGIMGKGLAYQFKVKYPLNFKKYVENCQNKTFDIGTDLIYIKEKEKIIINFPTKRTWKENSKIEYIIIGLLKLEELIIKENITSISIPPLGAGNGKLDWELVKKQIISFEERLKNKGIKVVIYEPTLNEIKLSRGHLLLLKVILRSYDLGIKKEEIDDFILQKLTYLGDKNNYFKFEKQLKGPFSKLINILYKELKEYRKITQTKIRDIEIELEKKIISDTLKSEEEQIKAGIELYKKMKEFYNLSIENKKEIEDKMELLTSVLFIINNEFSEEFLDLNSENISVKLKNWNGRKAEKFNLNDVDKMCEFLLKEKVLTKDIFLNYKFQGII